ncbi:MAG TPA: diguanylate cyclase [Rhodocyclaceae bacterium]|nr:diguanylate cyclase [Rhodocyclaceae bacterium]
MNRTETLAHDLLEAGNEHFQITAHPKRVLFWTTDSNGGCEVVSSNWTEYTGQALEAAHGVGWLDVIDPEDRPRVVDAMRWAIGSQSGFYLHYRICRPDGTTRRILHDASARALPSGKFNGLVGTLTDDSDSAAGDDSLENSAQRIYEFLDGVGLAAVALAPDGRLVHVNRVMAALLGKTARELIDRDWIADFVCSEDRSRLNSLLKGEQPPVPALEFEYQVVTTQGRRLFRWRLTLIRDASGAPLSFTMMGSDITQWRQLGNRLRLTAQMFDHSTEAMVITDHNNLIVSVNPAFTRLTGYAAAEAIGKNPRILQSGRHDAAFYQAMWESIVSQGFWRGDIWDRRKDGSYYPKFLAITALRDDRGEITHFSAIFYDVSERKLLEEKLESLAHYDPLTGLANRMLLQDRLEYAIATAERHAQCFALLFIDLDDFKPLNDTYGHAFGDAVLKRVGQRLGAAVRGVDTAARLGGDEFVVILTDIGQRDNAEVVAQKILQELSAPLPIDGESVVVTASIGISLYPNDETAAAALLRNADAAMYEAKKNQRQRIAFYGGLR